MKRIVPAVLALVLFGLLGAPTAHAQNSSLTLVDESAADSSNHSGLTDPALDFYISHYYYADDETGYPHEVTFMQTKVPPEYRFGDKVTISIRFSDGVDWVDPVLNKKELDCEWQSDLIILGPLRTFKNAANNRVPARVKVVSEYTKANTPHGYFIYEATPVVREPNAGVWWLERQDANEQWLP